MQRWTSIDRQRDSRTLRQACTPLVCLLAVAITSFAQSTNFRYFYDDAGELFRVLDSNGTLIQYNYDPNGNISQINRSTVPTTALSILNVAPLTGLPGQTVTIYGQNFSPSAAGDIVQINGVTATVVSASSSALVVQVPSGASGQVTVTVNGVTVNSGTLSFAPIPLPVITSITPQSGYIGQTVSGVIIQGSNLSGCSFTLLGGGVVAPVTVGATQATVNITLGQTTGLSVLTATCPAAVSSSQATTGNFFIVYNTPGTNYASVRYSALNASGQASETPAGSNYASLRFSSLNASGQASGTAAGSNYASLRFSALNASGQASELPAGSKQAFQLFSATNQTGTPRSQMALSMAQANSRISSEAAGSLPLRLIAGQTAQVTLQPPLFLQYLEIDVDGATLASSTTGSLSLPVTAPFGLDSFSLRAFGYTRFGPASDSQTETVQVVADPGRTITGRVIDASGLPVAGAVVTWQAQGLAAEYYQSDKAPVRTAFLGVLNYPNPQQVFGPDPMGVGLGKNYAGRLTGKLQVETVGNYQFSLLAHKGARLMIDGQLVAEAAAAGADATVAAGSASLTVGVHDIEVTHYESGGTAALQLSWTPPGGVEVVVPPAAITSDAPALWRAVTGSDGRFTLHVPAALDGVVVKLVTGVGSVQVDQ